MSRMLFVDDESELTSLLVDWFSDKGHTYFNAGSVRQALACIQENGPMDLVVTDGAMPAKGDGIRLLEQIQAQSGKPPPVILFAGQILDEDKPALIGLGFADAVCKPSYKDLEKAIDKFLKCGEST